MIEWEEIPNDGTLAAVAEKLGITAENLPTGEGAVVLPRNRFFAEPETSVNLYPSGTKELAHALTSGGINTRIYKDERDSKDLLLKSADILLPILMFIGTSAASVGLNILSSWIYDRFKAKEASKELTIKVEYIQADASGRIQRWRKVEGPASAVVELLSVKSRAEKGNKTQEPNRLSADEELREKSNYSQQESRIAREVGDELIEESRSQSCTDKLSAETLARKALKKLRESYLWEPSEENRVYLHRAGLYVHDTFGCKLEYADGQYWVSCPVLLSHSNMGFSIGGAGKTICSICGETMFSCPHLKGGVYNQVVARRMDGICSICWKRQCPHVEGEQYDGVSAFGIVVEISLDHISMVENPANPLCVVQRYSLSRAELAEVLPDGSEAKLLDGQEVYCHHCVSCYGKNKVIERTTNA
jgi:hypothetical protein